MSNYKVTQSQLDQLNKIVGEQGGTIPSEVSDALAALQAATAKGDKAGAKKAFDDAVKANQKNGTAWGAVQSWHNMISTQPIQDGAPGSDGDEGAGAGPGNSTTPTGDINVTLTWGKYEDRIETGDPFVMSSIIATLAVPADAKAGSQDGRFSAYEFGGSPCTKQMVVSTKAGDYTEGVIAEASGTVPDIGYNVGKGEAALEPGKTYYINTRNMGNDNKPAPGNYPSAFGSQPPK
jgi:hypothetical protein